MSKCSLHMGPNSAQPRYDLLHMHEENLNERMQGKEHRALKT